MTLYSEQDEYDMREEEYEYRSEQRYRRALAAHPDPRDPDYPERSDYMQEDEEEV